MRSYIRKCEAATSGLMLPALSIQAHQSHQCPTRWICGTGTYPRRRHILQADMGIRKHPGWRDKPWMDIANQKISGMDIANLKISGMEAYIHPGPVWEVNSPIGCSIPGWLARHGFAVSRPPPKVVRGEESQAGWCAANNHPAAVPGSRGPDPRTGDAAHRPPCTCIHRHVAARVFPPAPHPVQAPPPVACPPARLVANYIPCHGWTGPTSTASCLGSSSSPIHPLELSVAYGGFAASWPPRKSEGGYGQGGGGEGVGRPLGGCLNRPLGGCLNRPPWCSHHLAISLYGHLPGCLNPFPSSPHPAT